MKEEWEEREVITKDFSGKRSKAKIQKGYYREFYSTFGEFAKFGRDNQTPREIYTSDAVVEFVNKKMKDKGEEFGYVFVRHNGTNILWVDDLPKHMEVEWRKINIVKEFLKLLKKKPVVNIKEIMNILTKKLSNLIVEKAVYLEEREIIANKWDHDKQKSEIKEILSKFTEFDEYDLYDQRELDKDDIRYAEYLPIIYAIDYKGISLLVTIDGLKEREHHTFSKVLKKGMEKEFDSEKIYIDEEDSYTFIGCNAYLYERTKRTLKNLEGSKIYYLKNNPIIIANRYFLYIETSQKVKSYNFLTGEITYDYTDLIELTIDDYNNLLKTPKTKLYKDLDKLGVKFKKGSKKQTLLYLLLKHKETSK